MVDVGDEATSLGPWGVFKFGGMGTNDGPVDSNGYQPFVTSPLNGSNDQW